MGVGEIIAAVGTAVIAAENVYEKVRKERERRAQDKETKNDNPEANKKKK